MSSSYSENNTATATDGDNKNDIATSPSSTTTGAAATGATNDGTTVSQGQDNSDNKATTTGGADENNNNNNDESNANTVAPGSSAGGRRAVYVGGLDPRVSEEMLKEIFEVAGHVASVKIVVDRTHRGGYNYGFVEFDDPSSAEIALQTLNGHHIHGAEIRINWAKQGGDNSNINVGEDDGLFTVFVGDLSNEVNDEVLAKAFSVFVTFVEAKVMWDTRTGRSRGYGFVSFQDRNDAENAITSMSGEWLGSRAIRLNWATQRSASQAGMGGYIQNRQQQQQMYGATSLQQQQQQAAAAGFNVMNPQSYEIVLNQTPSWQTTVYVGNLTPYTTQSDLVALFQNFGYVMDVRVQDKGFGFIRFNSHESAAMSICQLSGYVLNGRPIKCSWGKDNRTRPMVGADGSGHSFTQQQQQQQQQQQHVLQHHQAAAAFGVSPATTMRGAAAAAASPYGNIHSQAYPNPAGGASGPADPYGRLY